MHTDQSGKFKYYIRLKKKVVKLKLILRFSGAATVRIAMPSHMQSSLIFHYNLKFYDNEGDSFDGVSLKRFVMQVINLNYFTLKF